MRRLLFLALFGVAMAYLESAVVVYLRQIYYPGGFCFPLKPIPFPELTIEIGREVSTIMMLLLVGILSYRKPILRFAAFIFTFGCWDIFYYIWLYIFLGWPPSLLTWDILFLIPVPWTGPVIAPLIVAATFVVIGARVILLRDEIKFERRDWIVGVSGAIFIFLSFIYNYKAALSQTLPSLFPWFLFIPAEVLLIISPLLIYKRVK